MSVVPLKPWVCAHWKIERFYNSSHFFENLDKDTIYKSNWSSYFIYWFWLGLLKRQSILSEIHLNYIQPLSNVDRNAQFRNKHFKITMEIYIHCKRQLKSTITILLSLLNWSVSSSNCPAKENYPLLKHQTELYNFISDVCIFFNLHFCHISPVSLDLYRIWNTFTRNIRSEIILK